MNVGDRLMQSFMWGPGGHIRALSTLSEDYLTPASFTLGEPRNVDSRKGYWHPLDLNSERMVFAHHMLLSQGGVGPSEQFPPVMTSRLFQCCSPGKITQLPNAHKSAAGKTSVISWSECIE